MSLLNTSVCCVCYRRVNSGKQNVLVSLSRFMTALIPSKHYPKQLVFISKLGSSNFNNRFCCQASLLINTKPVNKVARMKPQTMGVAAPHPMQFTGMHFQLNNQSWTLYV